MGADNPPSLTLLTILWMIVALPNTNTPDAGVAIRVYRETPQTGLLTDGAFKGFSDDTGKLTAVTSD